MGHGEEIARGLEVESGEEVLAPAAGRPARQVLAPGVFEVARGALVDSAHGDAPVRLLAEGGGVVGEAAEAVALDEEGDDAVGVGLEGGGVGARWLGAVQVGPGEEGVAAGRVLEQGGVAGEAGRDRALGVEGESFVEAAGEAAPGGAAGDDLGQGMAEGVLGLERGAGEQAGEGDGDGAAAGIGDGGGFGRGRRRPGHPLGRPKVRPFVAVDVDRERAGRRGEEGGQLGHDLIGGGAVGDGEGDGVERRSLLDQEAEVGRLGAGEAGGRPEVGRGRDLRSGGGGSQEGARPAGRRVGRASGRDQSAVGVGWSRVPRAGRGRRTPRRGGRGGLNGNTRSIELSLRWQRERAARRPGAGTGCPRTEGRWNGAPAAGAATTDAGTRAAAADTGVPRV